MSGNEVREVTTLSGSASPGALSSGQSVDVGASGQEEHGNDYSGGMDTTVTPPPLGVKLTGYRLFNMMTMFSFCIIKGILTYKGRSAAPTTLDWVSGGVLAVVIYWIGLYEDRNSKKWDWFFQVDLVHGICCCTKRVVAGVMWLSSSLDGLFVIFSLSNFLGNLAVLLFVRSVPHFPRGAQLGIYFGSIVCALVVWYSVNALTRRIRARVLGWQRAIRFVDDYGPASLAGQYGWFGTAGTIVARLFGGIALVGLSIVIYHYLAWIPLCVNYHATTTVTYCFQDGGCKFFELYEADFRCSRALTVMNLLDSSSLWECDRDWQCL